MSSPAFVAATPVLARATPSVATTSFTARRSLAVAPARRPAAQIVMGEKIPQGFTFFSEQLNGRAAMVGFFLAVATEAITGQGIVGQLSSIVSNVEHLIGM